MKYLLKNISSGGSGYGGTLKQEMINLTLGYSLCCDVNLSWSPKVSRKVY